MKDFQDIVKRFAEGKTSYADFDTEQAQHPELWTWLQSLLIDEILQHPNHPFWNSCHSYRALEANLFHVKATIMAFGFNSPYGQALAYDIIGNLAKLAYPDIVLQKPPTITFYDILDAVGLDCIGGRDAEPIARNIIGSLPPTLSLKEKKAEAKHLLSNAFHIGKKKPKWIQEPEWPVYQGEPMEYVRTVKHGVEGQTHYFRDPKTGVERTVEDWH